MLGCQSCCQIEKDLFILKFLYLFELAVYSTIFIYLSPFMNQWGVTVTELAIINFLSHLLSFFFRPIFGYLADRGQNYRKIIIIICLTCSIGFAFNLLVPKFTPPIQYYSLKANYSINNLFFNDSISICPPIDSSDICWPFSLKQCVQDSQSINDYMLFEQISLCAFYHGSSSRNSTNFTEISSLGLSALKCLNVFSNCNYTQNSGFVATNKNITLTGSSTFWILGILKIIVFSVYCPLTNLTDSLIFIVLGRDRYKEYGFTRMFGTIGVFMFSLITGSLLFGIDWIVRHYKWDWLVKMQSFCQFSICFILETILFAIVILIVVFMDNKKSKSDKIQLERQTCLSKMMDMMSVKLLCVNAEMAIFFTFSIFGGFIITVHAEYYIILIYKMFPDIPKYFPGLLVATMTFSEALFFGISTKLLKFFRYEFWVSVTFFIWFLRWLSYSFCNHYWQYILIDMLHGPTFGLQIATLISFIGRVASSNSQGRIQGLFSGLYFNIGGALGGFCGGIILDNLSIHSLFRFMCIVSLLCAVTYYPLQVFIIRRKCQKRSDDNNTEVANKLIMNNKEIEIEC